MTAIPISSILETQKDYFSPFSKWNESSWIRSKPFRIDSFSGLPFSPDLVPLTFHRAISEDSNRWITVLAYKLLDHLQFTTLVELSYVNPICTDLALGKAPIALTTEQRNDALRIYCDEGGHALFIETLSTQAEIAFGINRSVLGRPKYDLTVQKLLASHQTQLSPNLIKLFFVCITETLYVGTFSNVPHDVQVAPVVRAVISDHIADEALHYVYFRNLFPSLWSSLSPWEKEEIGQLLPLLVRAFLEPDRQCDYNILRKLNFAAKDADGILEEVYAPGKIAEVLKQAAKPALKMFEAADVFLIPSVKQAFENYELT
ncbi:diiron oxygenase [Scytonema sp. PCC 10023]|uniref:diiron oxygenase n=1 Tax=Scytonema sp. PCC 10023 TaxID=1680591 RepID=UPI0039C70345